MNRLAANNVRHRNRNVMCSAASHDCDAVASQLQEGDDFDDPARGYIQHLIPDRFESVALEAFAELLQPLPVTLFHQEIALFRPISFAKCSACVVTTSNPVLMSSACSESCKETTAEIRLTQGASR